MASWSPDCVRSFTERLSSGVRRVGYRIDAGPWGAYEAAIALPSGTHVVEHAAADAAGNVGEPEATRVEVRGA